MPAESTGPDVLLSKQQSGLMHQSFSSSSLSSSTSKSSLPQHNGQTKSGEDITIRAMVPEDYTQIRALLPKVSRCSRTHTAAEVEILLSCPNYFPFCAVSSTGEIVGYAELHRMPHMGRLYDSRLEKVIVKESMRGNKIASILCSHVMAVAKDELSCGRVDLTVEKPDAKTVYAKLGFKTVETEVWRNMFETL